MLQMEFVACNAPIRCCKLTVKVQCCKCKYLLWCQLYPADWLVAGGLWRQLNSCRNQTAAAAVSSGVKYNNLLCSKFLSQPLLKFYCLDFCRKGSGVGNSLGTFPLLQLFIFKINLFASFVSSKCSHSNVWDQWKTQSIWTRVSLNGRAETN